MKAIQTVLKALYAGMLNLYPKSFQAEFGAEMLAVFSRRAEAAAAGGWWSLFAVVLREIRDYPGSVVGEYLRAGRIKMANSNLEGPAEAPAPMWALLAVAIFIIGPGTLGYLPWPDTGNVISIVMAILVLVILFGPLIVGIKGGLPRWSLVYLGAILGVLGVYGVVSIIGILFGRVINNLIDMLFDSSTLFTGLILEWINHGWFWLGIVLIVLVFLGGLNAFAQPRKVAQRIWGDWTQLSFVFYGAVLINLFIDFDEYQHEGLYLLGCLVALAAGAWGYLRISHSGWRVVGLLAGLTVCMAIMGVGKYFLVPLQTWPIFSETHTVEDERWFESLRTIATWFWPAVAVGVPGLLQTVKNRRRLPASV